MNAQDWLGMILTALSILALVAGGVKWLVKHYLSELRENGGSSVKDQVNRLEVKVDKLYDILIENRISDSSK
jgi:hypothetical protein